MSALLIAVAVLAGIQPGLALAQEDELDALFACSEAEDMKSFELCNVCRPVPLLIESLDRAATDIGLTKDRLRITAESRLRAARLYTDSGEESNGAVLYINVGVLGPAVSLQVQYHKRLLDPVTVEINIAPTWRNSVLGTHSGDPGFIIQALSEEVDEFLVEYLRVNEKHCLR